MGHSEAWLSRALKRQSLGLDFATVRALPVLVTYDPRPAVVRALGVELGLGAKELAQALEFVEAGLPPLTRREWIPFLFGVSPKLIGSMIARPNRHYRRFSIRKRSGGSREIGTPRRFLKTLQRWVLHNVLNALPQCDAVHGFIRERSIFTNAQPHLGSRNLLGLDIRDFFPSVSKAQVKGVLKENLPFPEPVATQIAGLCCLDQALPQGAPTSPALANAAFQPYDLALQRLAGKWDCVYTRYADDLAFSGARNFSAEDIEEVRQILRDSSFALNERKTRICGPGVRQMVAGLVVNKEGLPPRDVRRRWRAMFHRAGRFPHEFIGRSDQLLGVAAFVGEYSDATAVDYLAIARKVRALEGAEEAL